MHKPIGEKAGGALAVIGIRHEVAGDQEESAHEEGRVDGEKRSQRRGATNQEIADMLVISEATVKSHIGNILGKLELRDRAAAIVFAFDYGLVQPAP